MDAAEALAGGEAGVPAKSRAAILRLETKWLFFLQRHGAEYGYGRLARVRPRWTLRNSYHAMVFPSKGQPCELAQMLSV